MKLIICSVFILFITSCSGTGNETEAQMDVVKNVDLNRYAGTWYDSFEKNLTGVTATYTLRDDGRIGVLNQGYKNTLDGRLKKARAVAKVPDPEQPGRLKVYFVPFFGAAYNILELDQEHYSYALVGSSSPDYLWILGREPFMKDETYQMLVNKAAGRGYDVTRLIRVLQKSSD
jgi:lipocalin